MIWTKIEFYREKQIGRFFLDSTVGWKLRLEIFPFLKLLHFINDLINPVRDQTYNDIFSESSSIFAPFWTSFWCTFGTPNAHYTPRGETLRRKSRLWKKGRKTGGLGEKLPGGGETRADPWDGLGEHTKSMSLRPSYTANPFNRRRKLYTRVLNLTTCYCYCARKHTFHQNSDIYL